VSARAKALRCPEGYVPACKCSIIADTPHEDCHVHGAPSPYTCAYCGSFVQLVRDAVCKRCGWRRLGWKHVRDAT
jgi:DNA-directed RNA polymerase subunit RPC12/RpoP